MYYIFRKLSSDDTSCNYVYQDTATNKEDARRQVKKYMREWKLKINHLIIIKGEQILLKKHDQPIEQSYEMWV